MTPTPRYFCTYFDGNYLVRGVTMIYSLIAHCPAARIWVLCMDHETFKNIAQLDLAMVEAISLSDFEHANPDLLAVKPTRTALEYYFSCTPAVPRYVLDHHPEADLITYLDADLFFYDDPAQLFSEIGTGSIGIVPHRRAPALQDAAALGGIYNVAWVTFRRDEAGLACLRWWHERCVEWCYNRKEDGKFGDQKYLDDWPVRFSNVVVIEHKGADLAPWNAGNYQLTCVERRRVYVDDQPLVFYHFAGLTQMSVWLYMPRFPDCLKPSLVLRRQIYQPYLAAIRRAGDVLAVSAAGPTGLPLDDRSWSGMKNSQPRPPPASGRSGKLFDALRLAKGILRGKFLVYAWGRVF